MSDRFVPGKIDYAGNMARDFNAGRAVSPMLKKRGKPLESTADARCST